MKRSCEAYGRLLARRAFDDVSDEERRELEEHLEHCPTCREEKERVEQTLAALGTLEDVSPGRHFFLYPQAQHSRGWRLGEWSFTGKLALAAGLLLALLPGAFWLSQAEIHMGPGELVLEWGARRHALEGDRLRRELLGQVEEKLEAQQARWREETRALLVESAEDQRQALGQAVTRLERRLLLAASERDREWRAQLEHSLSALYQTLRHQHQVDLGTIDQKMESLALWGEVESRQTSLLLDRLLAVNQRKTP